MMFLFQVQSDGALLIKSAKNADHTLFTCIGTNGFNFVEKEIQVIVMGKLFFALYRILKNLACNFFVTNLEYCVIN